MKLTSPVGNNRTVLKGDELNSLSIHIIEIIRVHITIIGIIIFLYIIRGNDILKIVKGEFQLISCVGLFRMIWTE